MPTDEMSYDIPEPLNDLSRLVQKKRELEEKRTDLHKKRATHAECAGRLPPQHQDGAIQTHQDRIHSLHDDLKLIEQRIEQLDSKIVQKLSEFRMGTPTGELTVADLDSNLAGWLDQKIPNITIPNPDVTEEILGWLTNKYGDKFSEAEYNAVINTLNNKNCLKNKKLHNIRLESGPESSVIISIGSEQYYADPENKYCVEHGNKGSSIPPEGKTAAAGNETLLGMR